MQEPIVRQTAATALLELYGVPDNMSPLDTFTDRFQTRYAELIYDVDEVVAVKGVRPHLYDIGVFFHSAARYRFDVHVVTGMFLAPPAQHVGTEPCVIMINA